MTFVDEMLAYNNSFINNKEYEQFITSKYPDKKVAVLTCMDTRLTQLLLSALNINNGDVKIIKNAGAVVSHPFGSVMRSLIIAIYELDVQEIIVIGHSDCGMQNFSLDGLKTKMIKRGISEEKITTIDYSIDLNNWLAGFSDVNQTVANTVDQIKDHPLIPQDIIVSGCVINPNTGLTVRIC